MERHRVGLLRLLATNPLNAALHLGMIRRDAGIGQSQHHQGGGADTRIVGPHRHLPRPVGLLLPQQPVAGLLDRSLNLLRGELRPLAVSGETDSPREEDPAEEARGDEEGKEESAGRHEDTRGGEEGDGPPPPESPLESTGR